MRILFVCTGNTCRSPMAEGLLRSMAEELQISDLEVFSAGTDADSGLPASYGACSVLEERGVDIFSHSSVQISESMIQDADLVLTMTAAQKARVTELCPQEAGKVNTLIGYAGGEDRDIPDPFGGDHEVYLETLDQIELALAALLVRLYPEHAEEIRDIYETKD